MSLTHRQREVVQLLCQGLNTKQIARQLGVVPAVVSNHLAAVRKANGLKNSAQIGIRAMLDGDIEVDRAIRPDLSLVEQSSLGEPPLERPGRQRS